MADKNKRPDEITNQVASILVYLEIAIYVSDLETNKIMFANKEMRLIHGGMPLIGQICWERFGGNPGDAIFVQPPIC